MIITPTPDGGELGMKIDGATRLLDQRSDVCEVGNMLAMAHTRAANRNK
jgi:hypothetical protein